MTTVTTYAIRDPDTACWRTTTDTDEAADAVADGATVTAETRRVA